MGNFVAVITTDKDIIETFAGDTITDAASEAIHYMMTEKPAESVRVVIHDADTEEVVESFSMTKLPMKEA